MNHESNFGGSLGFLDDVNSAYETATGTGSGGSSGYNVFTGGSRDAGFGYIPGVSELYNFGMGTIDAAGNVFGQDNLSNPITEVMDELFGRNREREMEHQRGVIRDEESRRNQLLKDERARQAEMDRMASESAAGAQGTRRGVIGRGGVALSMIDVAQGDLLGL